MSEGPSYGLSYTVRVPATSANLGPGFDALGLAWQLYDEVTCSLGPPGEPAVNVSGEGAQDVPRDKTHLVVDTIVRTASTLGRPLGGGLRLDCRNVIPHARGLGSSAAAICAGVLAAAALTGTELSDADALALATLYEGHPDNVAACLLGGLTVASAPGDGLPGGDIASVRLDPLPALRGRLYVPPFGQSTEAARGLLPTEVPFADAAGNAARAALLVAAITHDPSLLLTATEDRLHQPYRAVAMPVTAELIGRLRDEDGAAAVLSGAGPTVLVLHAGDVRDPGAGDVPEGWRALDLDPDLTGATVTSV